jgi:hypothetical protein
MRLLHQQRGGNIMNRVKCIVIAILLIIGPLSFSVAEEVIIPAEKAEAFTVDPATGHRIDLVFNKKSHRWEVPISSLERAKNPLAVNMPNSFFIRDSKTGKDYPVRWERYHDYVWGMDDRSSDLKNPSVEFITDYYPPGKNPGMAEFARQEAERARIEQEMWADPQIRQQMIQQMKEEEAYRVGKERGQKEEAYRAETQRKQMLEENQSQWQIPTFRSERRRRGGDVIGIDPRTGAPIISLPQK